MSDFRTPGVYIREIPTLPASIAVVETAIPAFIGHTALASKDGEDVRGEPTRITSFLEFREIFGDANPEAITIAVTDNYDGTNGVPATLDERIISATLSSPSVYKMFYSLQLFYANGGGPCYIVSVNDFTNAPAAGDATTPTSLIGGLARLEKYDEPTIIVFPDYMDIASYKDVYDQALAQCEKLKDRFVVMDVKDVTNDPFADGNNFRNNGVGIGDLKYGACYYPNLKTTLNYGYDASALNVSITPTYIGTGTPSPALPGVSSPTLESLEGSDPSLYRAVVAKINELTATLPPCGAVAGVYARVDSQRGVWKAPANVDVRSVIEPEKKVSNEQQESLNVDATSGKSINAIRTFTGKGVLIWGARTLAGNDNEWRYVPVRRFFSFVEESVKKATEFVVFEPNDANTWLRVKTMIENFLAKQWRDGALAGATTGDAFFVRVGLGQTMTSLDILEGRMNVEIGMAAVRPAEFIILKFSHKLQES